MKGRIFVNGRPIETLTKEELLDFSRKVEEVAIKAIGWEKSKTSKTYDKNTHNT